MRPREASGNAGVLSRFSAHAERDPSYAGGTKAPGDCRTPNLVLMEGEKPLATFQIPNPAPGPHPKWTASSLPIVAVDRDLEVTLEDFVTDSAGKRTEFRFHARSQQFQSSGWVPIKVELSDATGNSWSPAVDRLIPLPQEDRKALRLLGALWPEEECWKARVSLAFPAVGAAGKVVRTVEFLAKPRYANLEASADERH